jgi:hypothetical protein
MAVLWVVAPCRLYEFTNVSDDLTDSISREMGTKIYVVKIDIYLRINTCPIRMQAYEKRK